MTNHNDHPVQEGTNEGQYYYAKHRNMWGIWKVGKKVNNTRMDHFIMDFSAKLDAERFVYRMNGWSMRKFERR